MSFIITKDMPPAVKQRIKIEEQIASCLVKELLSQGFALSVDNNEEILLRSSSSYDEIMSNLFTTDADYLDALKTDMSGWVYLVYGNDGWDVISDYSCNLEDYIPETLKLIEELS